MWRLPAADLDRAGDSHSPHLYTSLQVLVNDYLQCGTCSQSQKEANAECLSSDVHHGPGEIRNKISMICSDRAVGNKSGWSGWGQRDSKNEMWQFGAHTSTASHGLLSGRLPKTMTHADLPISEKEDRLRRREKRVAERALGGFEGRELGSTLKLGGTSLIPSKGVHS